MKYLSLLCTFFTVFLLFFTPLSSFADNLLQNASFETQGSTSYDAYYWEYGNPDNNGGDSGNFRRYDWRSHSGSWEGTIRGDWGTTQSGGGTCWQQVAVTPGSNYVAGCWFWADWNWTAASKGISIAFYDASMNHLDTEVQEITTDESWQWYQVTATAPVNAAWGRIEVYASGVGDEGALQFDDAMLQVYEEEAAIPSPTTRRTHIVFSEIMYHPIDRVDGKNLEFVELYNTEPIDYDISGWKISGEISYTFPINTIIPANDYLVVASDPTAMASVYTIANLYGPYTGKLSNASGSIELDNDLGAELLHAEYDDETPWPAEADGAGHSLVLSDGSYGEADYRAYSASIYRGGSPGEGELTRPTGTTPVINEFLAHTDLPLIDFIELYNPGSTTLNIAGYILEDSPNSTNAYTIPPGTSIPAQGVFTFYETTLGFQLSSDDDQIFLINPDETRVVDAIAFGGQKNGVSTGRYPDGAPGLHALSSITANTSNSHFLIHDVVINEIMYHPISEDTNDEYIELYNKSGSSIDISYWRFTKGIDFTIPAGTIIPANSFIVIAENATNLIAKYSQLNPGNTIGNYDGSLSDRGEKIVLVAPDDPANPNDLVKYIVDEVTYVDGGDSRKLADGDGSSLELRNPHSENRFMMNWKDSDESSKSSWTSCSITGVLTSGMTAPWTSIDQVDVLLLRRGDALIDNVEIIPQGQGNYVRNSTFESGSGWWEVRGNHVNSGFTSSDAYSGTRSMRITASGNGNNKGDRITGALSSQIYEGSIVTMQLKARWLSGSRYVLMRLLGNYLEMPCELNIPDNLGTPAQQNSCYASNVGPAIHGVTHEPAQPTPGENVTVSARVYDSDGLASVRLKYRIDPSASYTTVSMSADASGRYTATLPGQSDDTMVAFYVEATDSAAATMTYPQDTTDYECLVHFDNHQDRGIFAQYTIWMRDADMNTWNNRTQISNQLLPATFISRGRIIYDAGIRYRGSPFVRGAYSNPEYNDAGYRIDLPHNNRFLDATELNLDWLESGFERDPTYQRERATYRVAYDLGLPVSYQRYVEVYLQGRKRGTIYTDSQHPEEDYVQAWYKSKADGGELYKIDDWFELNYSLSLNSSDFANKSSSLKSYKWDDEFRKERYRWNWNKKDIGIMDDDYSSLYELIDAANLSGDEYTCAMENICNVRQWITMIAFRHAVGDWDSFGYSRGKNMMGFRPHEGKWELICWDVDYGFDSTKDTSENLFWVDSSMPKVDDMIQHSPFKRYYWQALDKIASGPFQASVMDPILDATYDALIENGTTVDNPSAIKSWVSSRRSYIESQLSYYKNIAFRINESSISSSSNQVRITGSAPIQDIIIKVDGIPTKLDWSSEINWSLDTIVPAGNNLITITGCDEDGNQISGHSDTVWVSYTGSDQLIQDYVVINEIMYNPLINGTGFIELLNTSSSSTFDLYNCRLNGVDFTFTEKKLIKPGEHILIVSDPVDFVKQYGNNWCLAGTWDGSLANSGEWLRLQKLDDLGQVEFTIDEVRYNDVAPWPLDADGLGKSLQLIDPNEDNTRAGNWATGTSVDYTPGALNSVTDNLPSFPSVWINEVQPNNTTTVVDNTSHYDPWLELYNAGTSPFNMSGYYLTDDYNDPFKWALPSITIPASDFQLIWADSGTSGGGEYHANFTLSASGGSVALVYNDGGSPVIVDYMNYDPIQPDRSYGCYPDGVRTNRANFYYATPGSANSNADAPFKIYINEWMADNETGIIDPTTGIQEDWFELYNAESFPVDITGYSLTDDVSNPDKWTIEGSVILQPGEFRLVWADKEPAANAWGTNVLHADFSLAKGGEVIALYGLAGTQIDAVTFLTQTTDITQGRFPDGANAPFPTLGSPTPGASNVADASTRIITATAGDNGSISPAGGVEVTVGQTASFTITADTYYEISDVLTNGVSTGDSYGMSSTTFHWFSVQDNGTIHAVYEASKTSHGTPYYWIAFHGLSGANWEAKAATDHDSDGMESWKEYLAGTDPNDPSSLFEISIDRALTSDSNYSVYWPSITNRYYTLYRTDDLLGTSTVIYNRMPADPPNNAYDDLTAPERAYYWVQVEE